MGGVFFRAWCWGVTGGKKDVGHGIKEQYMRPASQDLELLWVAGIDSMELLDGYTGGC